MWKCIAPKRRRLVLEKLEDRSLLAVAIDGVTLLQAEDFNARTDSADHRWWVVGDETVGTGGVTGETGEHGWYVQALNLAAEDNGFANISPDEPSLIYSFTLEQPTKLALDVRGAGPSSTSDSLWATIPGAELVDAEGWIAEEEHVLLDFRLRTDFTWIDSGVWELEAGDHELHLSMRDSGAAVDAIVLEPLREPRDRRWTDGDSSGRFQRPHCKRFFALVAGPHRNLGRRRHSGRNRKRRQLPARIAARWRRRSWGKPGRYGSDRRISNTSARRTGVPSSYSRRRILVGIRHRVAEDTGRNIGRWSRFVKVAPGARRPNGLLSGRRPKT